MYALLAMRPSSEQNNTAATPFIATHMRKGSPSILRGGGIPAAVGVCCTARPLTATGITRSFVSTFSFSLPLSANSLAINAALVQPNGQVVMMELWTRASTLELLH